jgi:hypothetical protein
VEAKISGSITLPLLVNHCSSRTFVIGNQARGRSIPDSAAEAEILVAFVPRPGPVILAATVDQARYGLGISSDG